MKTRLLGSVFTFILILSSCDKAIIENQFLNDNRSEVGLTNGQVVLNFRAHLSGDQEVPPRETLATGQAVFQLSKDGTELSYKLIVANLDSLSQAHIHVAAPGVNGSVVAWLYPSGPPALLIPGTFSGVLNQGVITADDLVGPLAGQELSVLLGHIISGNTYVNVHTSQFPGGEIRGQIEGNTDEE